MPVSFSYSLLRRLCMFPDTQMSIKQTTWITNPCVSLHDKNISLASPLSSSAILTYPSNFICSMDLSTQLDWCFHTGCLKQRKGKHTRAQMQETYTNPRMVINKVSLSHHLKAIRQLPSVIKWLMTLTKGYDYWENKTFLICQQWRGAPNPSYVLSPSHGLSCLLKKDEKWSFTRLNYKFHKSNTKK